MYWLYVWRAYGFRSCWLWPVLVASVFVDSTACLEGVELADSAACVAGDGIKYLREAPGCLIALE
jgi:hypothetical protein